MNHAEFDIAVLGGGVSGLGVAREARRRGRSVVVLERNGVGAATSSNSLRIIHGGFRYLQGLQLPRVVESVKAQSRLLEEFPDHINPLPCALPLSPRGLTSRLPVSAALLVFQGISGMLGGRAGRGRILDKDSVPAFAVNGPSIFENGALLWFDAALKDPQEFHAALADDLATSGGEIRENWEVEAVARRNGGFLIQSRGGDRCTAKVAVNCQGAWVREIRCDFPLPPLNLSWWCGYNLCLDTLLSDEYALGVKGSEGRYLFLTPRRSKVDEAFTAVGTWYTPGISPKEGLEGAKRGVNLEQALIELRGALPGFEVAPGDISDIELGILPAERVGGQERLIGSERIIDSEGYLEIISTKYTTFQTQAHRALDRASKHLG